MGCSDLPIKKPTHGPESQAAFTHRGARFTSIPAGAITGTDIIAIIITGLTATGITQHPVITTTGRTTISPGVIITAGGKRNTGIRICRGYRALQHRA